ncbi:MAG: DUF885 domain-containing protein [Acidobacteriota bacterium]
MTVRSHLTAVLSIALSSLSVGCDRPATETGVLDTEASTAAAAEVSAIGDAFFALQLAGNPFLALQEGRTPETLWDLSHERAVADAEVARRLADRLAAIDPERLDDDAWLNHRILAWELEVRRSNAEHFWLVSTLTPYTSSFLVPIETFFAAFPFDEVDDLDRYLGLVAQVPGVLDGWADRVRGQLERGIAPSRHAMPAIQGLFAAKSMAGSTPYAVVDERLDAIREAAGADRLDAFHDRVEAVAEGEITAAWQRFVHVLVEEVEPAAVDGVGIGQYPGGEAAYRDAVRLFASFEITPEAVHEQGVALVATIEAAMDEAREATGFEGDREAFREHLRSDPRFRLDRPEAIADTLRRHTDAMLERFDQLFMVRQRAPWDVERLPLALEPGMTYGYYDAPKPGEPRGIYRFNGSNLDQRNWLELESLAYHELIPGHHYQIARQQEADERPAFRRHHYPTAYIEGWATYASSLGREVGLYQDPYSSYGGWSAEAFLACRLVLDTGMNLLGWDLDKGRAYMAEHTRVSAGEVASETLRYSTDMPGQALAYQLGQQKILAIRRQAERALGERFDVRAFHEVVVGDGPMPLGVLADKVDRWVASRPDE